MNAQDITTSATEADLEAELDAAMRVAFPLLPRAAIRHQTQFSFKFGHAEISLNGLRPRHSARARADVILYFEDKPLAVLELKRKDIPLEAADGLHGLSYAKLLNPMPPLVVVSNGVETRYLETHGAKVWSPANRDELAFKALMDNADESPLAT
jgi:type I site-specific restriction endonuclease